MRQSDQAGTRCPWCGAARSRRCMRPIFGRVRSGQQVTGIYSASRGGSAWLQGGNSTGETCNDIDE